MPPATPLRVLVVDDYADAADLMAEALSFAGYEVDTADSGTNALELAAEKTFAAAFVDIGLPDIDGFEIARRLRTLPGGERLLLIALTGHGTDTDRRLATEAGFDLHLVKPVDLRSIITQLAERLAPSH